MTFKAIASSNPSALSLMWMRNFFFILSKDGKYAKIFADMKFLSPFFCSHKRKGQRKVAFPHANMLAEKRSSVA